MKFAILVLLGLAGIAFAENLSDLPTDELDAPDDPDFSLENYHSEYSTYDEAQKGCEAQNQRLLYPANKKQVEQVIRFMRDHDLSNVWIGVNRPPGGEPPYQWRVHMRPEVVFNTALFAPDQPDNRFGSEFCVEVRDSSIDSPGRRLNDMPCWERRTYFCVANSNTN